MGNCDWIPSIEPFRKKFQETSLDEVDGPSTSMSWPNHAPKHIISDVVYGSVKVPSPIDKIIDTVEFQRLRNLKQTGLVYRVYPNCEHSRFVHSLGTFSLAHNLVDKLRHNQPSLDITSADHCCVSVAALLHDVGHGPFSHLFDGEYAKRSGRSFKHEEMSVKTIHKIMQKGEIRKFFEPILGRGTEYDENVHFITELISMKPFEFQQIVNFSSISEGEREETVAKEWKSLVTGRGPEKSFLYDIVSNSDNGHDVDKMDYLLRDSKASGFAIGFSETSLARLFDHVRVVIDPNTGLRRIGYSLKCTGEIKSIGDSRQELHSKVYQHRAVRFIETLMVDALFEAGPLLKYEGSNGRMYSLGEVTEDIEAYLKTSDFVEQEILNSSSTDPRMIKAKSLLVKIQRREIGSKLGCFEMSPTNATQANGIDNNEMGVSEVEKKVAIKMKEILKEIDDNKGLGGKLTNVNFRVMHSVLGRGLDEKTHPIEKQIFYEGKPKDNDGVPMMGCYVDEDYVLNNCPRMATKWEIFVMGDRSLKEEENADLACYIKQALRLAGESEKFLTPRKRSPPLDEMPDPTCSVAAKRRLFSDAR
uniref:HD domain-containing protein n=2 Tax=Caenorhabditis tropicalis TaxID=1561998 RepID=A0A1I7TSQ1_9PELO